MNRLFRLVWIDACLAELGEIRRRDIVHALAITPATASGDIKEYMCLNPGAVIYDTRARRHVTVKGFTPLFPGTARFFVLKTAAILVNLKPAAPPRPGSREAIARGCSCAVPDNAHGRGILGNGARNGWRINATCPLHALPEAPGARA